MTDLVTESDLVATMKELLRDPAGDIKLEDLMRPLARRIATAFADQDSFPVSVLEQDMVGFVPRWLEQVRGYEDGVRPILSLVRLAGAYGRPEHVVVWEQVVKALMRNVGNLAGHPALVELRGYPTVLVLHVAAIAAASRENWSPLVGFAVRPMTTAQYSNEKAVVAEEVTVLSVAGRVETTLHVLTQLDEGQALDEELIRRVDGGQTRRRYTPMSDHLHHVLRELFRDEFDDDVEYDAAFDRAEIMLDAIAADAALESGRGHWPGGNYGRYTWKDRYADVRPEGRLAVEAGAAGASWGPTAAGLFGGDAERAVRALEKVQTVATEYRKAYR